MRGVGGGRRASGGRQRDGQARQATWPAVPAVTSIRIEGSAAQSCVLPSVLGVPPLLTPAPSPPLRWPPGHRFRSIPPPRLPRAHNAAGSSRQDHPPVALSRAEGGLKARHHLRQRRRLHLVPPPHLRQSRPQGRAADGGASTRPPSAASPDQPAATHARQVGPRFEMRLYQISLGTADQRAAETEWVLRPYMNTAKKRKAL